MGYDKSKIEMGVQGITLPQVLLLVSNIEYRNQTKTNSHKLITKLRNVILV